MSSSKSEVIEKIIALSLQTNFLTDTSHNTTHTHNLIIRTYYVVIAKIIIININPMYDTCLLSGAESVCREERLILLSRPILTN